MKRVRKPSSRQQPANTDVSMNEPVTVSTTNQFRLDCKNGIRAMKSPSRDALMRGVRTNSQNYCASYQVPVNITPNRRTTSSQSKNSAFYSEQVPSYTPISTKKEEVIYEDVNALKKHNF